MSARNDVGKVVEQSRSACRSAKEARRGSSGRFSQSRQRCLRRPTRTARSFLCAPAPSQPLVQPGADAMMGRGRGPQRLENISGATRKASNLLRDSRQQYGTGCAVRVAELGCWSETRGGCTRAR